MSINQSTRREVLKGGLALAGLGILNMPAWAFPALAQDETLVPFTDLPDPINVTPAPDRRILDIRTIDGPFTPIDQFYTVQHYGHPVLDPASFRLQVAGLVERPLSLSVAEIRQLGSSELIAGFECSGNRRPLQGLVSNGRWTGVPLQAVLERAGLQADAREVVFFGADRGEEEVEFRTAKYTVTQQFGRSLPRDKAMSPEPFLAYALNGEPLTRHQGAPLRLIVPGWYGVANVKWLSDIHAQAAQYLGKYQARWYRTMWSEMIDGEMRWHETAVTAMRVKSFIARVTRAGSRHNILGVVVHDGTPLQSVEIRIDDGPWQPARLDPATSDKYSWKLFTYVWEGATPGEHTLVSRVTDTAGRVQPEAEELAERKVTPLEDHSQHPRRVMIS